MNLAFGAALAEAARHQDTVHVLEMADGVVALEDLGVHPLEADLHVRAEAAVRQRLGQRLVGIEQHRVLADHRDRDLALGLAHRTHDAAPAIEVRFLVAVEVEILADLGIESLIVIGDRHLVDRVDVPCLDHPFGLHVAEQRDLATLVGRNFLVARTADQQVGLDTDTQQFLHGMLRRLGLEFARRRHPRQKGKMHEHRILAADLVGDLSDGFEERSALDVAHGAADLDQDEFLVLGAGQDEILDGVGDVRDHLHGGAEIFAAAFPGDHRGIDAAGGDVVGLLGVDAGEALVVTQIEVGLRPVIGHENLAVLIRAHRARIDVQIGVEFAQPDSIATGLQQRTECG